MINLLRSSLITAVLSILATPIYVHGNIPSVPKKLRFANLSIKLSHHARREIQDKVDRLWTNQKGLRVKVTRAHLYFPIIERVLKEENVPVAFKYLAIQESALIANAISSSNAVGFWQFKVPAAKEVKLRIDRRVDERMHIVHATRGAARYLKRNNFYFDNWMYALTAYYTGKSGAESYVDMDYMGKHHMVIGRKNHWYIKTFIAHMIVFEKAMADMPLEKVYLQEYKNKRKKSLKKIADEFNVPLEDIKYYNRWLLSSKAPADKTYVVLVPRQGKAPRQRHARTRTRDIAQQTPLLNLDAKLDPSTLYVVKINNLPAIVAHEHDNLTSLIIKAGISKKHFMHYNEMEPTHPVRRGQIYYLDIKRSRADEYYHVVHQGETLWEIAQRYGMKIKHLRKKNRMKKREKLVTRRVLWLRKKRPRHEEIVYVKPTPPKLPRAQKPAKHAAAPLGKKKHTVTPGETLYSIAKHYGVNLQEMLELNKFNDNTLILPEQDILIPLKKAVAAIYYVVQPGDTLISVAKEHKLSVEKLMQLNKKASTALAVGERLKVSE